MRLGADSPPEDLRAMEDPRLEQAFNMIRAAFAEAYERGRLDEAERIKGALFGAPGQTEPVVTQRAGAQTTKDGGRQRAPKGSVRALVRRALLSSGADGATPQEIHDMRSGDAEGMIAIASIRGELRRGREENIYSEAAGKWRLADPFDII